MKLSIAATSLSLLLCAVFAQPSTLASRLGQVANKDIAELSTALSHVSLSEPAAVKFDESIPGLVVRNNVKQHKHSLIDLPVSRSSERLRRLKPTLDRIQEVPERSVARPVGMEHDGVIQGNTASCHIFATNTIIQDATGVMLSNARAFLDHLVHPNVDAMELADYNVDLVDYERTVPPSKRSSCNFAWESGHINSDFERLQEFGGVVVPSQEDFKDVEEVLNKLHKEREALINMAEP